MAAVSCFDFGSANDAQRRAITSTEGPLLITAGPGTGKTFTLVKRVSYLVQEKGVDPSSILVATFTEKAAKELVTRISNELAASGIEFDVNDMYVGTFHSICLRLIKEHIEFSNVRKNYRVADSFDQQYLVYLSYWSRFKTLEHFTELPNKARVWDACEQICSIANAMSEELVDVDEMLKSKDPTTLAYAEVTQAYNELLTEKNWLDFAHIQLEAYQLLAWRPEVLAEVNEQIKYVMVDEYQDTNYIQEQLTLLLGKASGNVCVVGDDDQGLYRFRGATIRNILEFPEKFGDGRCEQIALTDNYRSDPGIVAFYNDWMERTAGPRFRFDWDGYRFEKSIKAVRDGVEGAPAVVKIGDDEDDWCETVCGLVRTLKERGVIDNYNQIAFLFKSVKHRNARDLAECFEERGISVYSPRSDSFFDRDEVRLAIGILLLLFPSYIRRLETGDFKYIDEASTRYYVSCVLCANELLKDEGNAELRRWIASMGRAHSAMTRNTDYAFSGLVYQLFEFEPFKSIIDTPLDTGVHDQRAVRNLSTLIGITSKFEYLQRVDIFTAERIDKTLERFFSTYLRFLMAGGIDEYEDDTEYVPSGCVPFLTIHQSKGMEFPIVVVDSLYATPTKSGDEALQEIKDRYGMREAYEPLESIKYFDFWRLYYTAFSRAQDLLVLTHREGTRKIGKAFEEPYGELPTINPEAFPFERFSFHHVKESDLKPVYSFTTDISLYEGCAVQYKLFRELGFTPVRVGATLFGQLVHQTIEDVHRAALRGETERITAENAADWLQANYETLSKSQHAYLSKVVIEAAKRQVQRYIQRREGRWGDIVEAEVQIGIAKPDYIIHGTVDLIEGDGGTVDIVDFKSERKPDVNRDYEKLETYRKQLMLYAHLIEEKTGRPVGKMRLYYTGEESGNPEITFSRDSRSIDAVADEFDEVAHRIMKKDYSCRASNARLCENCDFRYYCKN